MPIAWNQPAHAGRSPANRSPQRAAVRYRRTMRRLLPLAALLALAASPADAAEPPRPNVVLVFIDDMGFGDVGFNGATVPQTPHLDRMAAEGTVFRDFYVGCAVCTGSRAALLTGRHYRRLGVPPVLFPDSEAGLSPAEATLADMLSAAGYDTACIGKWHLGHLHPCLPTDQGFDSYWGIPYSNDMWRDPANAIADDVALRQGITPEQLAAGHKGKNQVPILDGDRVVEYPADQTTLTKRYTERAVAVINDHAGSERPFFVYLPHSMVHRPLHVSPAFENPAKSLIANAIEEVDWSVGQIVAALRQTDQADDTLVIFTSDNGAAVGSSEPLRAKKGSVYDGGIREPTVMWWPGQIPAGRTCEAIAATVDLMPTLAGLCGGELPDATLDGHDIWPLMSGASDISPHDESALGAYVLLHGPGCVRSGRWKFYPWPENKGKGHRQDIVPNPSPEPVQLYDIAADIGETSNVAAEHPEVVSRLQAAYDARVADIEATARQATPMPRPNDAISPERPPRAKPPTKAEKAAGRKRERADGFVWLFDGTSFDGWEQSGNWTLQPDRSMFRTSQGGFITHADPLPDDFELRFEWKVGMHSNSGVYYRPGQNEYQILSNEGHKDGMNPRTSAASLYFGVPPTRDATRPPGQWNTGRIVAHGSWLEHWLNGERVVAFDAADPAFAENVELLRRRGGDLSARGARLSLQDHGDPVWFRNIRLRTLGPEHELDRTPERPATVSPAMRAAERKKVEGIERRRAQQR